MKGASFCMTRVELSASFRLGKLMQGDRAARCDRVDPTFPSDAAYQSRRLREAMQLRVN